MSAPSPKPFLHTRFSPAPLLAHHHDSHACATNRLDYVGASLANLQYPIFGGPTNSIKHDDASREYLLIQRIICAARLVVNSLNPPIYLAFSSRAETGHFQGTMSLIVGLHSAKAWDIVQD